MRVLDVLYTNGAYHVQTDTGRRPILKGGTPLHSLSQGWTAGHAYLPGDAVIFLALRNEDGRRAVWFLDGQFHFLTNGSTELPEAARAQANDCAYRVFSRICASAMLWDDGSQPITAAEGFLATVIATDAGFLNGPGAAVGPTSRPLVLADDAGNMDQAAVGELGRIIGEPVNVAALRSFYHQDLLAVQIAAARTGRMSMPSPFDGNPLISDTAWSLEPDGLVFRFNGGHPQDRFFVILYGFQMTLFATYFPRYNLFLYFNARHQGHIQRLLSPQPQRGMCRHVIQFADRLPKPNIGPRQPVILRSYDHIGHHLWNELGGLDDTIRQLDPEATPPVIVADPEATEMYGQIEAIFPELRGRVFRTPDVRAATDATYHGDFLPLRPTGIHVSRRLASRIGDLAEASSITRVTERLLAGLRAAKFRFAILGLRVENRTVVDFPAFCEDVIEILAGELGRVAVIVDGQNSSAKGLNYRVTLQAGAPETPLQIETAIVERLEKRFAGHPNVVIISTIGLPVGASIALCIEAECFVTPWGAGLAKYRWICNRPGLALAGPTCTRMQPVHLYDDPKFTEASAPMYFMGPGEVEDAPDDPVLMPGGLADRVNIRVDREALRARIHAMVAALTPPPAEPDAA